MHELAAVGALVEAALATLERHPGRSVASLRVRRGSAFSDDALRQSFALLSRGTRLEGATLDVEVVAATVECSCGRRWTATADDLVGHLCVCAACGAVRDLTGAEDLELAGLTLLDPEGSPG